MIMELFQIDLLLYYATAQFATQHALFNVIRHCPTTSNNPESINFVSCHATTFMLDEFVEMTNEPNP